MWGRRRFLWLCAWLSPEYCSWPTLSGNLNLITLHFLSPAASPTQSSSIQGASLIKGKIFHSGSFDTSVNDVDVTKRFGFGEQKERACKVRTFFMVKTWWTLNNILATNLCKRCGETSSILGRRETARAFICSSSIKTLFAKLLRSQINSLPHQWLVTISVGLLLLLSLLVLLCTFVSRSFPGGAMPGRRLRMFDRLRRSFQRNNCLSPGVCDSQVSIIIMMLITMVMI